MNPVTHNKLSTRRLIDVIKIMQLKISKVFFTDKNEIFVIFVVLDPTEKTDCIN